MGGAGRRILECAHRRAVRAGDRRERRRRHRLLPGVLVSPSLRGTRARARRPATRALRRRRLRGGGAVALVPVWPDLQHARARVPGRARQRAPPAEPRSPQRPRRQHALDVGVPAATRGERSRAGRARGRAVPAGRHRRQLLHHQRPLSRRASASVSRVVTRRQRAPAVRRRGGGARVAGRAHARASGAARRDLEALPPARGHHGGASRRDAGGPAAVADGSLARRARRPCRRRRRAGRDRVVTARRLRLEPARGAGRRFLRAGGVRPCARRSRGPRRWRRWCARSRAGRVTITRCWPRRDGGAGRSESSTASSPRASRREGVPGSWAKRNHC